MPRTATPSRSLRAASARGRREATGFGHAQVAEIQRARILAAMFDVATERGVGDISVADVVKRSGVSRRTFYETFSDREDCFLAAFEDALAFASQRVLPAYQGEKKWRDRIRAGLMAFLSFLDEEQVIGRLLILESLSAGPRTLRRRGEVLGQVALAVDEGRVGSTGSSSPPRLTAEGLVGGVLSLIHTRIAGAGEEPLVELVNQLMSMIVLPYQGIAAARRELERPVVIRKEEQPGARLLVDPFKEAGMRLTYRTVCVLLAVAEHPGASNRTIGESAGITDQGQMSKLLGRVQRLGLISNTGMGPGQGGPNAWTLTGKGRELTKSIHVHTNGSETVGDEMSSFRKGKN